MFIRSTGERVLAQVGGHSEHGDAYAPESARDVDVGAESDVSSLTFAEELPDAPTTDDDSDLNSDTEVVWVKSARGVCGMGAHLGLNPPPPQKKRERERDPQSTG